MRVNDRWNQQKRDNNWFSGDHYLPHWYYTLFGLLSSNSNSSSGGFWFFGVGGDAGDLAALILLVMLIIFIAFMIFCMLPFVVVTASNIWTSLNTLINPENIKDFLMALTTLLVVAGVITACVYLFPVISGALVGYAIAHSLAGGLGVAAAVCSTFLIGLIGLSSEMLFHSLVARTCDGFARLFGFETPDNSYSTAIHSENTSSSAFSNKTQWTSPHPTAPPPSTKSQYIGRQTVFHSTPDTTFDTTHDAINENLHNQDLPPSYDYATGTANAMANRY